MNFIIKRVNNRRHTFYTQDKLQEKGYYLTKSLAKIFMDYLAEGIVVDFNLDEEVVIISKKEHQVVASFNKIIDRKKNTTYFDIEDIKDKMYLSLQNYEHYLFIDFEMSMPEKKQTKFRPEIIQAGMYLTDINGKILYNYNRYIYPKKHNLSDWTIKFLNLNLEEFEKNSIAFKNFYYDLLKIYNKYKPQIIVWGENDYDILSRNIKSNRLKLFYQRENFTNLLKLIKGYFQSKRDLGLFEMYKELLDRQDIKKQAHNAYEDAYMTKEVYFYFLNILKEHYNKPKE